MLAKFNGEKLYRLSANSIPTQVIIGGKWTNRIKHITLSKQKIVI